MCFAASLSDPETLHILCLEAQKAIKEGIEAGWRPDSSNIIALAKTQKENFEKRTSDRGHHDWFQTKHAGPNSTKFMDQLAVQWYLMCDETNEEDWKSENLENERFQLGSENDCFKGVDNQRVGEEKDAYFRKDLVEPSEKCRSSNEVDLHAPLVCELCGLSDGYRQKRRQKLASDLMLAFVNTRDDYGNSALHLAVEHHNLAAITWLVKRDEKERDMSGLGRVSLTLLNWKNLTPFTLSVRAAKEDPSKLETYRQILKDAYMETIWRYGNEKMSITSLYQIDTFRVRGKKLHDSEKYKSALQILVDLQVPAEMPELAALIDEKWKKFAFYHHIMHAILPFGVFTAALTSSILLRIRSLKDVHRIVFEDDLKRQQQVGTVLLQESYDLREGFDNFQFASQIAADVIVYLLGVPFLVWNAWFTSRWPRRHLDVNQDNSIAYDEVTMYVFKNLNSFNCAMVTILLVTSAAIRLSSQPNWFTVSIDTFQDGTLQHQRLSEELDIISIAGLLTWANILMQLIPFHGIGILLIKSWRMLLRGVFKWLFIQIVVICGFSLACHVLVYDFTGVAGDGGPRKKASCTGSVDGIDNLSTDSLWSENIQNFVWTAMGDVQPKASIDSARSPSLALTIHITFVVVSTVVLMNLLISMMNNEFAKDTNTGRQIWWFEYASVVLRYEAHLSAANKVYYRCGAFDRYFLQRTKTEYVFENRF